MIDLAEIRAAADPRTFPTELLRGARSAACFYCAAFGGRQDVIHVADAGVPEALLVDTDGARLGEMLPYLEAAPGWSIRCQDAIECARNLADVGRKFDVVILDPFTGDSMARAMNSIQDFLTIATLHVVAGVSKDWFDAQGVPPDSGGLDRWADENIVICDAVRLVRRSDFRGGTWWAVLEVL